MQVAGEVMSRSVTDEGKRVWACTQDGDVPVDAVAGQDVDVSCTTASVPKPVRLKLGWQWAKMSDNGLARMIVLAAPVPRK
jgi:hypothetical protein